MTSSDTVFPDANGTTSDVFRFNTATLAMDIVSVNNVPVQSTTPFSTIGDDPTRCSAPVGDLRVGGVISDDGSRVLMHGTPCDWDNDPFSHWLCPDCENCCICDPSMGFPAFQQVYLRDMNLAATPPATFMVSRQVLVDTTNGDCEGLEPGNGCSRRASISGDGTRIAFSSFATNFRSDEDFDEDSFEEVFWIDTADVIAGVSPPPCKQPVRASIAACPPIDGDSFQPMLSSDGNWIAFASDAKTLLANPAPPPDDCPGPDTNGSRDVFVHDVGAQTTVRFSVDSAGVQGDDDSKNPDLTGDGRRVVYESLATNLLGVNNDMNDGQDIFESPAPQGPFIRGDANNSGTLNITDIVVINNWLFQGGSQPPCIDAADANDDGRVDVSDPDYLGVFLFQGGPQPPCPFCSSLSGTSCCGKDPTGDGLPCGQPLTGCTEFQSDGTCPTCQ